MTMGVMHCLTVKLCAVFGWTFATCGETSMVAFTIIEAMIDVSVKAIVAVEPRSRPDE